MPVSRMGFTFAATLVLVLAACSGSAGNAPGSAPADPSASASVPADLQLPVAISPDGRFTPDRLDAPAGRLLIFAVSNQPGADYDLRVVDAAGATVALLGAISNTGESEMTTYLPLRRPDGTGRLTEGLAAGVYRIVDALISDLALELTVR